MTTNRTDVVVRDYADRAARYLAIADVLNVEPSAAYAIAEEALDFDRYDDVIADTLLLLAQASFRGDDDYDDFRHELRVIIDGPESEADYMRDDI